MKNIGLKAKQTILVYKTMVHKPPPANRHMMQFGSLKFHCDMPNASARKQRGGHNYLGAK